MKLEIVTRNHDRPFGLPRYSQSLRKCLEDAGVDFRIAVPSPPGLARPLASLMKAVGADLDTFLTSFPLSISLAEDSVKHFTEETLATLLRFSNFERTIVTVHDISPDWLVDRSVLGSYRYPIYRLFHRLSLAGLREADLIITDTQHIKEQLVAAIGYDERRIVVIPLGVAHDLFRPQSAPPAALNALGLDGDRPYILHVGTDAPRKNVPGVIKAFAQVNRRMPNLLLVKVGKPAWMTEHQKVQDLIRELDLESSFVAIGHVSDEDLAVLYNGATLLVYPSFYEGFGLPVLEAMACGTPVITSNTSCLPEVAGNAAITVDPYDVEALAGAMHRVLADADLQQDLRRRGLERAAGFTWERTAQETVQVYREVQKS